MHPIISKLQADPDPTSAVRELLNGARIVADAAGIEIRYAIVSTGGRPDASKWQAGIGHIHAALAMLGTRLRSPFGDAIRKLAKLPTAR